MNYFDDIHFLQAARVKSCRDGKPGNRHDFWGIGLMLGNGCVRAFHPDRGEKIFKMPFLYLIRPEKRAKNAWGTVNGAEHDNRWFIIQGPRAKRMITALEALPETDADGHIHLKSYHELIRLHEKMLYLFQRNIPSKAYRLAVCLEEFAGAVYDALDVSKQGSPVFRHVALTAERIASDPGAAYDLRELAREQRISCDHFRRCFQQYAGMPIHEFLLEKRLALAQNLLRGTCDSIKEISERCGFPRQAEFARFIKRRTGATPSELRKQPPLDF